MNLFGAYYFSLQIIVCRLNLKKRKIQAVRPACNMLKSAEKYYFKVIFFCRFEHITLRPYGLNFPFNFRWHLRGLLLTWPIKGGDCSHGTLFV